MKVLITGGAGYIGTELVRKLNNDSNISEIIVYDNLWKNNYNLFLHSAVKRDKVTFIKGELLDSRKLTQILEGVDIVYHLAARVAARLVNASHHLYEQINNWGTAELVYAVEKSNVKKFIYASSVAVYGDNAEEITEKTIPNPKTYYGASKYRGEEHVQRLMSKIDTYILRIGNVYGYGISMRFDTVLNKFMFDAEFKGRIKILGNGSQNRPFINIDKLTDVLGGLKLTGLKSGVYNVVEYNMNVNDLVEIIKNMMPETEMLFVNQHLKLRNIKVKPDSRIIDILGVSDEALNKQLQDFKTCLEKSSGN